MWQHNFGPSSRIVYFYCPKEVDFCLVFVRILLVGLCFCASYKRQRRDVLFRRKRRDVIVTSISRPVRLQATASSRKRTLWRLVVTRFIFVLLHGMLQITKLDLTGGNAREFPLKVKGALFLFFASKSGLMRQPRWNNNFLIKVGLHCLLPVEYKLTCAFNSCSFVIRLLDDAFALHFFLQFSA